MTAIVTCKGRLAHLQQSLPTLIAGGLNVVVVDYDCPDRCGDWVEANEPKARVVRVRDRPLFNACEARNLGAALADTAWLAFLDADVCVDAAFNSAVEPLLQPDAYFLPQPRPDELWGAIVLTRADFNAIEGYDEAFEGWGAEDVDIIERLMIARRREGAFPGGLLVPIKHDNALRTRFGPMQSLTLNGQINGFYRTVKNDLLRNGRGLDIVGRRQLYADIRKAFLAPGGVRTFQVPFRDALIPRIDVKVTLRYDLTPQPPRPEQ